MVSRGRGGTREKWHGHGGTLRLRNGSLMSVPTGNGHGRTMKSGCGTIIMM